LIKTSDVDARHRIIYSLHYTTALHADTDLAPTLSQPMNDIKEYFTANKHPLINRSARINQRLRATTGLERRRTRRRPASLCRRLVATRGGRQLLRQAGRCQLWRQRRGLRGLTARSAVIHKI